jgi:hypothetical protein
MGIGLALEGSEIRNRFPPSLAPPGRCGEAPPRAVRRRAAASLPPGRKLVNPAVPATGERNHPRGPEQKSSAADGESGPASLPNARIRAAEIVSLRHGAQGRRSRGTTRGGRPEATPSESGKQEGGSGAAFLGGGTSRARNPLVQKQAGLGEAGAHNPKPRTVTPPRRQPLSLEQSPGLPGILLRSPFRGCGANDTPLLFLVASIDGRRRVSSRFAPG